MFGSRSFGTAMAGSNSLDVPVASLAGLAVAFLAFAAPADLLEGLVAATGIAALIPAAQPPLGLTARVALGAGGSVVVFGIALLALRWLGRVGTKPAEQAEEAAEPAAPRLRRRDIHPDAPARAPLLAVHELGEPALELSQAAPEPEPEPQPVALPEIQPEPQPELAQDPLPPLLARKPDRAARPAETEPTIAPEPEAPHDPAASAYALSQRNWADFEPEAEAEPEPDIRYPSLERAAIHRDVQAEAAAPPVAPLEIEEPEEAPAPLEANWYAMQAEPEPAEAPMAPVALVEAQEPWSDPEGEPEAAETPAERWMPQDHGWPDPEAIAAAPEHPTIEPIAAAPVEAEPAAPLPVGSIAELMERLEKGLARHRPAMPASTPAPIAMPAARAGAPRPLSPDPSDDRLQSAIESLQRFASRQD
jgi:hypothetical protein